MAKAENWITVAESSFPWERDALDFVRSHYPTHEPYRAWSNFEFIADDGSINEVDLLLLTPAGLFLIEIKSRPGTLRGDAGTWTWKGSDGKLVTDDNPLLLANQKAKKLKSLLQNQKAVKTKGVRLPFVEALVFCSAPELSLELQGTPQGEPRDIIGRDHHIDAYSLWLAGGGIKGGAQVGKTDELGYYTVEDQVHVHDLQATVLHLLGLDHLKLTYRFQGRDFRLTDVAGEVVRKLLA